MLALPVGDPEIETIPLFDDPFMLAVPAAICVRASARSPARHRPQRLILLEEGHCLRDQALSYCAGARPDTPLGFGATSLATVMQMVANGYGVTLVPRIAVDVEVRDHRVKLLRFTSRDRAAPLALPGGTPRRARSILSLLGHVVTEAMTDGALPSKPASVSA